MSAVTVTIPSMIKELHHKDVSKKSTMVNGENPKSLADSEEILAERPSMINGSSSNVENVYSCDEDRNDEEYTSSEATKRSGKRGKRKKYQKYTPEDRYAIGKYCFEHGPAAARKAFQDRYPEMSESVTRGFRDKYKQIIGETAVYEFEQQRQKECAKRTGPLSRGRPRKYRKADDEDIPVSMVARNASPSSAEMAENISPPRMNVSSKVPSPLTDIVSDTHHSLAPSLLKIQYSEVDRQRDGQFSEQFEDIFVTKKRESTRSAFEHYLNDHTNISRKDSSHRQQSHLQLREVLKIGKMSFYEGLGATLRKIRSEHPHLILDDIKDFQKKYMEIEERTNNTTACTQPQVFILENENPAPEAAKSEEKGGVLIHSRKELRQAKGEIYKDLHIHERNGYSKIQHENCDFRKSSSRQVERPIRKDNLVHSEISNHKKISQKSTSPHNISERSSYDGKRYFNQHRLDEPDTYHRPCYEDRFYGQGNYKRHSPSRSPIHCSPLSSSSTSIQASTVPSTNISPQHVMHYPKQQLQGIINDREGKLAKRNCNTAFETNGYGSYPYDNPRYTRSPSQDSNGSSQNRSKRFKYQKYTPADRYNIGKLCSEIGLGATVKVYREQFPRLNESVVRTFRNKYRELIEKGNGESAVEAIERKPSRRSMSSQVESEVVSQLKQFKISKIELSAKLVMAVGENVIASKDACETQGLRSMLTNDWALALLWKHKLIEKQFVNPNNICCERCQTRLICPKCPNS